LSICFCYLLFRGQLHPTMRHFDSAAQPTTTNLPTMYQLRCFFSQFCYMDNETPQPSKPVITFFEQYGGRTCPDGEPNTNYQCAPRGHHNSLKAAYSKRLEFAVEMYDELRRHGMNRYQAATEAATCYDINEDKLLRIARKTL
jgi:hypothetical protein